MDRNYIDDKKGEQGGNLGLIAVTNNYSKQALAKADLVIDNLEKISSEDLHNL